MASLAHALPTHTPFAVVHTTGRHLDLVGRGPIKCERCPEKAVLAARWVIEFETVGYAIGGPERRLVVCPVCLDEALDYALAMNVGTAPPVLSRIPAREQAAA